MTQEPFKWNQNIEETSEKKYKALVRSLRRRKGFGLLFVECSPAQGKRLIEKVKVDLPQKKIADWNLDRPIDKFYDLVKDLVKKEQINILFIQGLEYSLYEYEKIKRKSGWESGDIYAYSWKGVPQILNHLNQQRERFRDNFDICFVFLLPRFAINYFIQRATDFFDWRSRLFKFPMDAELLQQESSRMKSENLKDCLALTPQERQKKIIEVQALIDEEELTLESKADLFIEKGRLHHASEEYEEAIADYDQALKIKPDDHEAWNNRGIALFNLGRLEEAIADYDQALKIKPDFHKAWNNRGIALLNLGRLEEAIASFDQALKIKPDFHQAWYNKACYYALQGNVEQAIENLQQAIALNPEESREMAKTDSDFDKIREDERFQAVTFSYKSR